MSHTFYSIQVPGPILHFSFSNFASLFSLWTFPFVAPFRNLGHDIGLTSDLFLHLSRRPVMFPDIRDWRPWLVPFIIVSPWTSCAHQKKNFRVSRSSFPTFRALGDKNAQWECSSFFLWPTCPSTFIHPSQWPFRVPTTDFSEASQMVVRLLLTKSIYTSPPLRSVRFRCDFPTSNFYRSGLRYHVETT